MSETGSFLDFNLDEVPELHAVPGNREYRLKVRDANVQESKGDQTAGQDLILMRFNIEDEPDTKQVTYPIMLPHDSLDEEQNNNRKRQLKRVVEALGLDPASGFNIEELVGEECWAILTVEESAQYGETNSIKRFINPK